MGELRRTAAAAGAPSGGLADIVTLEAELRAACAPRPLEALQLDEPRAIGYTYLPRVFRTCDERHLFRTERLDLSERLYPTQVQMPGSGAVGAARTW